MANLGRSSRFWKVAGGVLVLALAVGGGFAYYRFLHRDDLPIFPYPDVDEKGVAGTNDQLRGTVYMRTVMPVDYESVKISPGPLASPQPGPEPQPDWVKVTQGNTPLRLATVFNVAAQSQIQVISHGNWITALDGDGEFIFEDAREPQGGIAHTAFWFVKKGTFRAKFHDYDSAQHWMQIRFALGRIVFSKAEVGLRVAEGGGGQVWLVSGQAVVIWNDGRRKVLIQRGMDYI